MASYIIYILYPLSIIPYSLSIILYFLSFILYMLSFILYPLSFILYPLPASCIPYPICCILYPVSCSLYPIISILYPACILHPVFTNGATPSNSSIENTCLTTYLAAVAFILMEAFAERTWLKSGHCSKGGRGMGGGCLTKN